MTDSSNTPWYAIQQTLGKEPLDLVESLKLVKAGIVHVLGNVAVATATKSQVMGQWNAEVFAVVQPAIGEWLTGNPKITLYHGTDIAGGPVEMEPFLQVLGLWKGYVYGACPEPHFAKLDVEFMDAVYTTTTISDVKEVTVP